MHSGPTSNYRKEFAARLLASLLAVNLSISATSVARGYNLRAGGAVVTTHCVRKWLRGESIPGQGRLLIVAEWLNVNASWLRFGDGSKAAVFAPVAPGVKELSNSDFMLIHDVGSLSLPAQSIIRDIVDSFLRSAAMGQETLMLSRPNQSSRPL